MGNDYSAPFQLVPQVEPICITAPRFVPQHSVTLVLHENSSFSTTDYKIKCAATGKEYFTIEGRTFSSKKVLRDNVGIPIVNLKEKKFSSSEAFYLFAEDSSERKICKFHSSSGTKAKLKADFQDVLNPGRMRHIVLRGDWRNKRAVIYLGEPKQGGIPIGNVKRNANWIKKDEYWLEIVSGVDAALMVIMCIALDIHYKNVRRRDDSTTNN